MFRACFAQTQRLAKNANLFVSDSLCELGVLNQWAIDPPGFCGIDCGGRAVSNSSGRELFAEPVWGSI
jgi:hypothetical protein